jgi:hypothetical protein
MRLAASRPEPEQAEDFDFDRRSIGKALASISACFLPVAAYVLAHIETQEQPWMWALVFCALLYSCPSVIEWARIWSGGRWRSIGFAILLEGVMIASSILPLSVAGLAILVAINGAAAWNRAADTFK